MTKTVITHFYNEEWLLPWWLLHHKRYFDHGILVDYHSTDASCEIIKSICPTWDIVKSKYDVFHTETNDLEIYEIEKNISGWRACLTVPEFLVGNFDRLTQSSQYQEIIVGQWVLVEPNFDSPSVFDSNQQLIMQCSNGLPYINCYTPRTGRRISNCAKPYPPGRHYYNKPTYNDLSIFYFGWASLSEPSIARQMQHQTKLDTINDNENPHIFTRGQLIEKFKELQSKSTDIRDKLEVYLSFER